MADRVLRDQCEHGRYDWHDIKPTWSHPHKPNPYENNHCPGGREVTIDYEALARYEHKRYRLAANAFYDEAIGPWDDLGAGSRAGLIAGVRHRFDAASGRV